MKSVEEALKEFRERYEQLTRQFDRAMEFEKLILSQMTRDRTIEEIHHLDQMAKCCEAKAREINKKTRDLAAEMKSYLNNLMEEP